MKYRSEFGNTVNFIVTDHSLQDEDYPENSINAAYYRDLNNKLHKINGVFRPSQYFKHPEIPLELLPNTKFQKVYNTAKA